MADDEVEEERLLVLGKGDREGTDNSISTSKYTIITFLPWAFLLQFRRFANLYFAGQATLMLIGWRTDLFPAPVLPWSIIAPLGIVVALGLVKEGVADLSRHKSDAKTNTHKCTVLCREDDFLSRNGKCDETVIGDNTVRFNLPQPRAQDDDDEDIGVRPKFDISFGSHCSLRFEEVQRRNIYAGDLVLVRNRDIIPADLVLLASSGGNGAAYVETSSIDGETNLKLRKSGLPVEKEEVPKIDTLKASLKAVTAHVETLEEATVRVAKLTVLGYPLGIKASENPRNGSPFKPAAQPKGLHRMSMMFSARRLQKAPLQGEGTKYVSVLVSEQPNASVNTFTGKLTTPPKGPDEPSVDLPLDAENMLLRGAVLRNTEWAIGIACFTGADTKLVRNSIETPNKLSRLDMNVNRIVLAVLCALALLSLCLGVIAVIDHNNNFENLWYVGFNSDTNTRWPYHPDLPAPEWKEKPLNVLQFMFAYITLLYNIIPLSAFITLEMIVLFMMFLINWDLDMYYKDTDLPAIAQSNIVSDLGQVGHIFSDKTGTLTQNVMRFKRCTVDGTMFGEPLEKAAPTETVVDESERPNYLKQDYKPLSHLLQVSETSKDHAPTLSFNTEMFFRVMSLCHTVVVEKDIEPEKEGEEEPAKKIGSVKGSITDSLDSDNDGAPEGFQYQAESPDEAALVQAASINYGFQLVSRDSSTITLSCSYPSILSNEETTSKLKDGTLSTLELASTSLKEDNDSDSGVSGLHDSERSVERLEDWTVLAVNKFDSDRKRMSVIVRSPPEYGSMLLLLCKGADATMLEEGVTEQTSNAITAERCNFEYDNNTMLGILSHLGVFASEGLRTLVLGIRVLQEDECRQWLQRYKSASNSMTDRSKKLKNLAKEIETDLHIVGATAIEDKLQVGVPETISKLMEAGIKLWVLTGDKKETAIEIGYSTKVLIPKMQVTQITDGPPDEVRGKLAVEFMSLVKWGRLGEYQLSALQSDPNSCLVKLKEFWFGFKSFLIKLYYECCCLVFRRCYKPTEKGSEINQLKSPLDRYRATRDHAESLASRYLNDHRASRVNASNDIDGNIELVERSDEDEDEDEESVESKGMNCYLGGSGSGSLLPLETFKSFASIPMIFTRAKTATNILEAIPQELDSSNESDSLEEVEHLLSSKSIAPVRSASREGKVDHTLFEKAFANDSDVRSGKLSKHKNPSALGYDPNSDADNLNMDEKDKMFGQRALIIEGSALTHFLGDPLNEELLYSVANCCDSVIACRVTPKQKAMVVRLVKDYAVPSPVTLSIGDGANDVGMIQEANVGVGISGLEGQQAANCADFAIGQFRFLEDLLLVHGRWNFTRLSKTILFSFYKNGILSLMLIFYAGDSMFSATALVDIWIMAIFNFVSAVPIMVYGVFDRDLEKKYVKNNPYVYATGPKGDDISTRMKWRWVAICVIHTLITYYITDLCIGIGGSMTTTSNKNPGENEGGGLKVYGTTMFSSLIFTLAYKVLYEKRSLIYGDFPAFICKKDSEGFVNRIAYTWVGIIWFSFVFYFVIVYGLQFAGLLAPNFMTFLGVTNHVLVRPIFWLLLFFIPIVSMVPDVMMKLFGNMYFPTQLQIHMEIQNQNLRGGNRKIPVSTHDVEEGEEADVDSPDVADQIL